ncbi:hypothetical protein [Sediminicoccus rosea]|jgi:hypothetical protein|uniref:Uncharacterized protein n=1 Tax=Sediminicoccus rosea TaxID=1225128 RepID=A0ABZ0PL57_9PROT|nr:hypothetical protein [Sediminicoccus rosea]WPB86171.1 hypothetical protein R9Z33_04695 [Sediminicoccus rosea]
MQDPSAERARSAQPVARASRWREAADLLRFSLEAAAVSGAIVMTAWVFSGTG